MQEKSAPWFTAWYVLLAIGMVLLCLVQFYAAGMPPWTGWFGHKTTSTTDLWTLGHVSFGLTLGWAGHQLAWGSLRETMWRSRWYLWALTFMCLWEVCELPMELGLLGSPHVVVWKAGVEHWSNRFISDPLAGTLGCVIYRRFPRLFVPAVVFGTLWWAAQASMPTCMTIQEMLF